MRRISLVVIALALGGCAHAPAPQSEAQLKPAEPAPSGSIPAPVQISTLLPEPKPTLRPETYTVVVNGVRVQELLFALARDVEHWPAHLSHYRWVRWREVTPDHGGVVEMAAVVDLGGPRQ